jgi:hypothetical protein
METLNINEIEDFFMMLDPQLTIYSYELRENFKSLQMLISTYNSELNKRLILARKLDLIEFFSGIERKTLYYLHIFKKVKNQNIKNKLYFYIQKIRSVNKSNILKFV